ncbi:MAG: hypothetical protein AB8G18_12295 [Gammaproteobacteria bacterium]
MTLKFNFSFKSALYALCTAVFCVTASAGDDFLLAYYIDIYNNGEDERSVNLQQYGQFFNKDSEIYNPIGRGGRGKISLSLVSLGETTGVLRLEIYDDKAGATAVKSPTYSRDFKFSKEGAKGDLVDSNEDFKVDFSYSIVPK